MGCGVEVITGRSCNGSGRHYKGAPFRTLFALRDRLRRPGEIDEVVLFPYGRFSGAAGWVNRAFLALARKLCASALASHSTVFYSCAGMAIETLGKRYAPALAVGRTAAPGIQRISLGIHHSEQRWKRRPGDPTRWLYLCGYQHAEPSVLEQVLDERGLQDLLLAGPGLAALGVELTIAIPLLRDAAMRDLLEARVARHCPMLEVHLTGSLPPLDALLSHDVFVFPYRTEHAVFVPTSLLEAMSVGIPVLAADHAMYADLTHDRAVDNCALHRAADPDDLLQKARALFADYEAAVARSARVRERVRSEWTLEHCSTELLDFFDAR